MSEESLPVATKEPLHGAIAVLPDALINKIAAGEVVERPASVVKELLENAVDAGAKRITIQIENGGRTLIRITDDGSGMSPEDAPLAFARHATSKIRTMEDLFAIATMGFRGEAIASVAGVSHARIITRRPADMQAVSIEAHESVIGPATPCAGPPGTTIEIRDLFYCIPARRKFLRTDATEFGHIQEMVLRTALAFPGIGIQLSHNGRTTLDLPPTADHPWRIVQALGAELKDKLLGVNLDDRHIRISGWIGLPETARGTARYQYLFLNGRFIRDRSLLHAIKEAYRGLIEPNSQPVAVIFVWMDPEAFDVNVHPQKTEVRFREPNLPYRAVLAALREQLLARDLTAVARFHSGMRMPTDARHLDQQSARSRQVVADFFRGSNPPQPGFEFPAPATTSPAAPAEWPSPPANSAVNPPAGPLAATSNADSRRPAAGDWPEPAASGAAPIVAPDVNMESGVIPVVPSPSAGIAASSARAGQIGGYTVSGGKFLQVHDSYLVVEESDGLLLIDQHALHERIIYEQLLARVRKGPMEAQRLLMPVVVSVNPRQMAIVDRLRPMFERVGMEISEFDPGSVAVQSLPTLLARLNPVEYIHSLLDRLLESSGRIGEEELLHEVLDMAACKAAIKAGDPLAPDEIRALLSQRLDVERSSNCPHGRPTTIRLSLRDLEKQFKRR